MSVAILAWRFRGRRFLQELVNVIFVGPQDLGGLRIGEAFDGGQKKRLTRTRSGSLAELGPRRLLPLISRLRLPLG